MCRSWFYAKPGMTCFTGWSTQNQLHWDHTWVKMFDLSPHFFNGAYSQTYSNARYQWIHQSRNQSVRQLLELILQVFPFSIAPVHNQSALAPHCEPHNLGYCVHWQWYHSMVLFIDVIQSLSLCFSTGGGRAGDAARKPQSIRTVRLASDQSSGPRFDNDVQFSLLYS